MIERLQSVQGVISACIYDTKGGIIANSVPPTIQVEELEHLSKLGAGAYVKGRSDFPDIMEISFAYEKSVVLVREADSNVFCIVVGEPTLNQTALALSLNELTNEVRKFRELHRKSTDDTPDITKNLLQSEPMLSLLQGMEHSLAKVMGPMAKIVFADSLEHWTNKARPSYARLPELIATIINEIKDPEKIERYRERISPLLNDITHHIIDSHE